LVPYRSGTPIYRLKSKTRSKTYCHMPYSSGSSLPAREGSGTATCPTAQDPGSLLGRALALSRVSWQRIPSPYLGGLWYCHVSHYTKPHLHAREGSGAAMCPVALDPTSLLGRAMVLARAPWLRRSPPCSRELQCCHVSHRSLWATDLKNIERLSWPTYAARLACFHGVPACFMTDKMCGLATIVRRRPS
jgi:hypothetical protein